jgi:hypothetical protein
MENMPDWIKWTVAATLLGGSNIATNGAQFLKGAEGRNKTEQVVMLSDVLGDQLRECYEQLNACYERCK